MSIEFILCICFIVFLIVISVIGVKTYNPLLASFIILIPLSLIVMIDISYKSETFTENIVFIGDKNNDYSYIKTNNFLKNDTFEYYVNKDGYVKNKVLTLSANYKGIEKIFILEDNEQAYIE